ncbi:GGDEF domain-containing protein [Streptomyces sp. NPDC003710]
MEPLRRGRHPMTPAEMEHGATAHSSRSRDVGLDRPLSILFADLDRFGEVNSRYGRRAGDQVIAAASARINKSLRREDMAFRLKADEFLITTHRDCNETDVLARQLISLMAQPFELIDGSQVTISVSIGTVRADTTLSRGALENLIHDAGTAVHIAKDYSPGGLFHHPHADSTSSNLCKFAAYPPTAI